jgi:hypothetical protein
MKLYSILLLLASISLVAAPGWSRDSDEAHLMLKEAMMESNADYNKHKKLSNHEEFDRADHWTSRDSQSISIGHTSEIPDISDFKEMDVNKAKQDREVSSTDSIPDIFAE